MDSQFGGPCRSLWSLIEEHVPDPELLEVRGALGGALVDLYLDLHSEVEMWREIWQRLHRGENHCLRPKTPLLHQQKSHLADPPAIKELLRAEICMLLQAVKEKASQEGRDGEEALSRYSPDTVRYALGHQSHCNGPGSPNPSRPTSCVSVQSSSHAKIDSVREKLCVADIDQVVAQLKSILIEECEALKGQVLYLQESIEQDRSRSETEPTIIELRKQREAIQMDLESPSCLLAHYPSSSSLSSSHCSSSSSPMDELRNRSSLSARQRTLGKTQQHLTPTPDLRPHPPPPRLSHVKHSPQAGTAHSKISTQNKPISTSSSSKARCHCSRMPSSSEPDLTQSPSCLRITCAGHGSVHVGHRSVRFTRIPHLPTGPGQGSDQQVSNSIYQSSPHQEHDSLNTTAGHNCGNPESGSNVQLKGTKTHCPESHRISLGLNCDCVPSPQTDRKNSPLFFPRSGDSSDILSPVPVLSPCHVADSYGCCTQSPAGRQKSFRCSERKNYPLSATERPKTQNDQCNNTFGSNSGSSMEGTQTPNGRRNSEIVLCDFMKRHSLPVSGGQQTQNGSCNNSESLSVPAAGKGLTQNSRSKNISSSYSHREIFAQEQSPNSHSLADETLNLIHIIQQSVAHRGPRHMHSQIH